MLRWIRIDPLRWRCGLIWRRNRRSPLGFVRRVRSGSVRGRFRGRVGWGVLELSRVFVLGLLLRALWRSGLPWRDGLRRGARRRGDYLDGDSLPLPAQCIEVAIGRISRPLVTGGRAPREYVLGVSRGGGRDQVGVWVCVVVMEAVDSPARSCESSHGRWLVELALSDHGSLVAN